MPSVSDSECQFIRLGYVVEGTVAFRIGDRAANVERGRTPQGLSSGV